MEGARHGRLRIGVRRAGRGRGEVLRQRGERGGQAERDQLPEGQAAVQRGRRERRRGARL